MGNVDSSLLNDENDSGSPLGQFIIHYISATDIPAVDFMSNSDPFLKSYLSEYKSQVAGEPLVFARISDVVQTPRRLNCTSVIWNSYRDFYINPPDGCFLTVELYDWGTEKQDKEPIGSVNIPIANFCDEVPKTFKFDFFKVGNSRKNPNFSVTLARVFQHRYAPIQKTIFLLRHGESKWNKAQAKRNIGGLLDRDHALTEAGIEQAAELNRLWMAAKREKECADAIAEHALKSSASANANASASAAVTSASPASTVIHDGIAATPNGSNHNASNSTGATLNWEPNFLDGDVETSRESVLEGVIQSSAPFGHIEASPSCRSVASSEIHPFSDHQQSDQEDFHMSELTIASIPKSQTSSPIIGRSRASTSASSSGLPPHLPLPPTISASTSSVSISSALNPLAGTSPPVENFQFGIKRANSIRRSIFSAGNEKDHLDPFAYCDGKGYSNGVEPNSANSALTSCSAGSTSRDGCTNDDLLLTTRSVSSDDANSVISRNSFSIPKRKQRGSIAAELLVGADSCSTTISRNINSDGINESSDENDGDDDEDDIEDEDDDEEEEEYEDEEYREKNEEEQKDMDRRSMKLGSLFASATLNEIMERRKQYHEMFFNADIVYSSPLTRAIQTAFIALEGHPAMAEHGLTLYSIIREIKGVGGLDTVGTAYGDGIAAKVYAELELLLGRQRTEELMIDSLYPNDAAIPWWTNLHSFDNKEDQRERMREFISFARYCDSNLPIFVGHSLFFKQFYSRRVSKLLSQNRPLLAEQMKKYRLSNATILAVTVLFGPRHDSEPQIIDADLIFGGGFHVSDEDHQHHHHHHHHHNGTHDRGRRNTHTGGGGQLKSPGTGIEDIFNEDSNPSSTSMNASSRLGLLVPLTREMTDRAAAIALAIQQHSQNTLLSSEKKLKKPNAFTAGISGLGQGVKNMARKVLDL